MDLDQLARTVKDLEYRVRALEKARGKHAVTAATENSGLKEFRWC